MQILNFNDNQTSIKRLTSLTNEPQPWTVQRVQIKKKIIKKKDEGLCQEFIP